ncbi:SAV_2336 N-terminal domain-related protein [Streptomyces sp. NPDC048340]|uniref:SAV_2336 N-terminal domain-related protein n=1 Tax=Streptomyces sp. NPDC048340 TaxID=3365537 RepID=UPI003718A2B0
MIEKLLAAFAEDAREGGRRPGIGAEEIADILWLAARVDPLAAGPEPPTADDPSLDRQQGRDSGDLPVGVAEGDPLVQLFPGPGVDPAGNGTADTADTAAGTAGARRGSPLRLPRAASLDDPLGLMRSLRPVGRRSIGGPGEELDEQLTVERSIERMVPTPVLRPAESRWLDLALVVDTHHSMLLWADLVDELRGVFTRSGVFRDVRTWQLTGTAPGGTPMVARGRGGPPRNPLELSDPAGRRLILVLSDTVAGGWRQAPLQGVLRHWCAHNAVAVLNVLPERLWTRGAVRPVPFAVRADRPAAATRSWQRVPVARRARRRGPVVPVVGIASGSLARLVRVVSGDGRWRRLACLRLDAQPAQASAYGNPPGDPDPAQDRASPLELVERFREGASPTAQQLAAHLAAVPLTLPVMTLVRRSLLRESEHGHLAEVALGGLFAPWGAEQAVEDAEFEFLPGVREALLGSQLRGDVAAVRELVRRRVWEFMSRNRDTVRDFRGIRVTDGVGGRREVPAGTQPFAVAGGPADTDPAPRDRVVRVRFEPAPEPQEVGVLLSPRMVLTVGDARLGRGAVAWVRSGDRETACRAVWWDEATPRVFLLLASEDLADPGTWSEPVWAAESEEPDRLVRLRVDGWTDHGDPVTLFGVAVPHAGERNGELIRLSAEPDTWTHYAGAPVSLGGELVGIVHSVLPDRMVYLTGRALLEREDFRAAVARERAGGDEGTGPGDPGTGVCLVLRPEVAMGPIGGRAATHIGDALMRVMGETAVSGQLVTLDQGILMVSVDGPRALGKAGRVLSELPGAVGRLRGGFAEWELVLGVSVATGDVRVDAEGAMGQAAADARRMVGHPHFTDRLQASTEPGGRAGAVHLVLCEPLRGLGNLSPNLMRRLAPDGGGPAGWLWLGSPAEVARVMVDTDAVDGATTIGEVPGWHHCGAGASATDPTGCIGIRAPGREKCLAHLTPEEQEAYFGALGPGAPVDLRGTTLADGLLGRLLEALLDPVAGGARLGTAQFDRARFTDDWITVKAVFSDRASFDRAEFGGRAVFVATTFEGPATFNSAVFHGECVFDRSRFTRAAGFRRAAFHGPADLRGTFFEGDVSFTYARWERPLTSTATGFRGHVNFDFAVFADRMGWRDASFDGRVGFTRAVFNGEVHFDHAQFMRRVTFEHAVFAGPVTFADTDFGGEASFREARFAGSAEFADATFLRIPELPGAWDPFESRTGTSSLRLRPEPALPEA